MWLIQQLRQLKHRVFVARKRRELSKRHRKWTDKGVIVSPHATLEDSCQIEPGAAIGAGSYLNSNVTVNSMVTIGNGVAIGPEAYFCTHTHKIGGHSYRAGERVRKPIVVKDGCWIGARVLVLPGVTIAEGCVIVAGAVVASDTEPDGLYAGVPAKRVKDLP